ncbi:hypothetical protein NUW54_g14059 [Trametes sanguinea]|uniref:Uncharacterized protein n=1 Tax=Trametes sanguinea TaxID=158606 RepID=A0ACC1MF66_9APHY|nr:hypothetical protein NUW54_g14059 [Trametes sanguinea]
MSSNAEQTFYADAVLFDMDGTLTDSIAAVEAAWGKVANDIGQDPAYVIAALVRGMGEAAALENGAVRGEEDSSFSPDEIDLTPLRLMIITREGGVPSYARQGLPHLLINLTSEYSYIRETFDPRWKPAHPTALSNLELARTCLAFMPPTSSAVMVSHRSPSHLIGNLITNKPAGKMKAPAGEVVPTQTQRGCLLGTHGARPRLRIVAGDYAGAAIVTRDRLSSWHARCDRADHVPRQVRGSPEPPGRRHG